MKRIVPFIRLSTQKGLTLLELIVSLSIGLFLLLAMALTYNIGFKVSQQVSDIASLHANARAVFERIGHDLMLAGYVDLMDQPTTPFEDNNSKQCLTFVAPKTTYASHTLDFNQEGVTKMYSRSVDDTTKDSILRNQLNTIGFVSCGQMLPVVGCDSEFSLAKPNARQLLPTGSDFTQLCQHNPSSTRFNPSNAADYRRDSQIQIAYQVQSVASDPAKNPYISLRNAENHRTDATGVVQSDVATGLAQALDCAGNPINAADNGFVVNRYRLNQTVVDGKALSQLQCSGNGLVPAGGSQWVDLANNIHEFKLHYRLGANEEDATELKDSRTSVIAVDSRIASELNRNISAVANGYDNISEKDLGWSRVVGVEVCLVVAGEPSDGIIPSNMAESQAFIPTCARDSTNRQVYAAGTPRAADDKKYYLRLSKTFAIPNSIFQFEVNRS